MASDQFPNADLNACAMPSTISPDGEETTGLYKLFISIDGTRQVVDIHEIEMDGWRLFECFLHGAETVVYLSQDEGETAISYVDMGDAADAAYATALITALTQFKKMDR